MNVWPLALRLLFTEHPYGVFAVVTVDMLASSSLRYQRRQRLVQHLSADPDAPHDAPERDGYAGQDDGQPDEEQGEEPGLVRLDPARLRLHDSCLRRIG